jgi:FkbM family methyltransferase
MFRWGYAFSMGLVGALRRRLTLARYTRRFGRAWATALLENHLGPPDGATADGSGLHVPGAGVSLKAPDHMSLALLRGLRFATDLRKRAGATFVVTADKITVHIDGLTFDALCEADLGVLHEIFVERLYGFEAQGPFFVVDVGANIGAAALFIAKEYGAEVESFELVPTSAKIAETNLRHNPEVAARIVLHGYGLADRDQNVEICVNPDLRPSNSLYVPLDVEGPTREKVHVRDAGTVFDELAHKIEGRKLLVKIDVEGAEYEIVSRLDQTGWLEKIDLLFLEWHEREGKDPEELRALLRKAGFRWFERQHHFAPVGMITAFR